jgi:hypothetical protein
MSHSRISERTQIIELLKKILIKCNVPSKVGFGPIQYDVEAELFTKIFDLSDNVIDEIIKELKDFTPRY